MFCTRGHLLNFTRSGAGENLSPVYFINTNLPGERVQVLLSKKELSELPDKNPNVFKKSNIGRYMEKPNAIFCNGKYSFLNNFVTQNVLAYYTLKN